MKYWVVLTCISLIACTTKNNSTLQSAQGDAIGTTYNIQFFADSVIDFNPHVDRLVKEINQSMSTYQNDSDISRINNGDSLVTVGAAFKYVFDTSMEIYKQTDGYFDPTIGNVVNAYGFGSKKTSIIPSTVAIDSLMQYVGLSSVQLISAQEDSFLVKKQYPQTYIEFNAIGKGALIDFIAQELDRLGSKNYLVEVGGEIVAKGIHLDKNKEWNVGIDDPLQQEIRTYITTLPLKNQALAGSGNYRHFIVDPQTNKKYVHTINPLTGESAISSVVATNVIAPNCTMADGYATAFMAMPLEKSKKIMHKIKDIEVLIMYLDDDNELQLEMTDGFKNLVNKN